MNDEINQVLEQLRRMEQDLKQLNSHTAINDINQEVNQQLNDYRQKIEDYMTYSRSPEAREMAKAQMIYMQSVDIILKDSDEQEEAALLYSEFTLDFLTHLINHTLCHLSKNKQNEKENSNA